MFLDGAMGTMVQRLKLQESDFRGTICYKIHALQLQIHIDNIFYYGQVKNF
jgi:methionine synthase I (cobalamin-dependent)